MGLFDKVLLLKRHKMMLLSLLYLTVTVVAVSTELQIEVDDNTFAKYGSGFPSTTETGTKFRKVKEEILPNGEVRVKYLQYHDGILVDNTGVVSSIDSNSGQPIGVTGSMYALAPSVGLLKPDYITSEEALVKAKEFYRQKLDKKQVYEFENEEVELKIVPKYGRVYEVNFFIALPDEPVRPYMLIDAVTGKVVESWEGLDTGRRRTTQAPKPANAGSGPGGNQRTGAYKYEYGGKYGTFYITKNGDTCKMENDVVKTIDLQHKTGHNLPTAAYSYKCGAHNENTYKQVNGAFSPMNDAHYFGKVLFDMYRAWANTNPLEFKLVIRVHYGTGYQNAFWNGREMTFGDGGSVFYPLVDVNVVAHEAAHGFTGQNSKLVYSQMSGGMNEAYSDIAGEAAEAYMKGKVDWMVGADIYKAKGKAMRYFATPEKNGRSIGHTSQYHSKMDVHFSSGIFNKAFYLMANSPGWDVKKGFQVFTLANNLYWTSRSTFDAGACGVLKATRDLGYPQQVVRDAFQAVGVVTSTCRL